MAIETIRNLSDATLTKVNDLVRVNTDSSKGFAAAADTIDNPSIASIFREISAERAGYANTLARYVEMNDEEANDSASISGTMHRWWLQVRGSLTGGDDYAVLAEAERGEDVVKGRYEDVLRDTAGSPLNSVLLDQYASVKRDHDRIRALRDMKK